MEMKEMIQQMIAGMDIPEERKQSLADGVVAAIEAEVLLRLLEGSVPLQEALREGDPSTSDELSLVIREHYTEEQLNDVKKNVAVETISAFMKSLDE